jgi:hypothetical protein
MEKFKNKIIIMLLLSQFKIKILIVMVVVLAQHNKTITMMIVRIKIMIILKTIMVVTMITTQPHSKTTKLHRQIFKLDQQTTIIMKRLIITTTTTTIMMTPIITMGIMAMTIHIISMISRLIKTLLGIKVQSLILTTMKRSQKITENHTLWQIDSTFLDNISIKIKVLKNLSINKLN